MKHTTGATNALLSKLTILLVLVSLNISTAYGQGSPICNRNTLKIGVEQGSVKPFLFTKRIDGQPRKLGFDIDLIEQVLLKDCENLLNKKGLVDYKQAPFYELFDRLRDGQFDLIISAISINIPDPARAGLAYSYPYFQNAGLALAFKKDSTVKEELDRQGFNACKKMKVYVKKGTTGHLYADENCGENNVKFPSESKSDIIDVFNFANDNEGRVIIYDWPSLRYLLGTENAFPDWEIYETNDQPYFLTHEQYGLAVRAEDYDLLLGINEILNQHMKEIKKLERKWFNTVPTESDFEQRPPIENAGVFVHHFASRKDILSSLTVRGGFSSTAKAIDEATNTWSLEWSPFALKVWTAPDTRWRKFLSDLECITGFSAEQSRMTQAGKKNEVTTNRWMISLTLPKCSVTTLSGIKPLFPLGVKPFVTFNPVGYTGLREKQVSRETGIATIEEPPSPITLAYQYGADIPVTDRLGLNVKYQRILVWGRPPEEIVSSVTFGFTYKPF